MCNALMNFKSTLIADVESDAVSVTVHKRVGEISKKKERENVHGNLHQQENKTKNSVVNAFEAATSSEGQVEPKI